MLPLLRIVEVDDFQKVEKQIKWGCSNYYGSCHNQLGGPCHSTLEAGKVAHPSLHSQRPVFFLFVFGSLKDQAANDPTKNGWSHKRGTRKPCLRSFYIDETENSNKAMDGIV
jgi:hypothetical protein